MPQYTFDDGFYHASKARDIAVGQASGTNNVLYEINALQVAIDNAASAGQLSVSVGVTDGESVMTSYDDYAGVGTSSYYDAWADLHNAIQSNPGSESTLRRANIEMDRVIAYFTRLGYGISRVRGGTVPPTTVGTDNRIQWMIKW